MARIRAAGVTDLCKPDRKIIAQASSRDHRIDILDAAARRFVGQGFAATSLDRVSDEIGLAGGAIYCYYRSKPDLFLAVHRRGRELAQRVIRPPCESEGKVLERPRGTGLAHAVLAMEQLPDLRVGDQELEMHLLERTRQGASGKRSPYIRIIKEGIPFGESRPLNLRLVAKSLLGALNRTLRWYHPHEGGSGAERMAESIGEFVGGLA
jgi:AcrR family transcriptional regulator